jgi:hypothetical protein
VINIVLSLNQRAALGSIVAESASLEASLEMFIGSLLNVDPKRFEIVFGGQMFIKKLEVVHEMGLLKLKSGKKRTAFTEIIGRVRALNADRVTVVHGIWGGKNGMSKLSWLMGAPVCEPIHAYHNKRGTVKTVAAAKLEEIATNIAKIHSELFGFWVDEFVKPKGKRNERRRRKA